MCELFNNINLNEDEIVEITELGYEDTIDIETDGNHLFFANDLLTHNSSVEEIEFDHSHISGGISKINTADNLFGIFTSRAMRERGRYQLQLMKTRSSSGVNSKIDLDFDVNTLRITDCEQEDEGHAPNNGTAGSNVLNQLKRNNQTNTDFVNTTADLESNKPVGKIKAEVSTSQLKNFLNNLNSE